MTENVIEPPFAGGKMRASWGASVARAVNAHEVELQSLRQPGKWQSLRVEDAETLAPFAVRLHKTENDTDGQWEIYLPPGCCNVGGTCEPINRKASEKSGHEQDGEWWCRLELDHYSLVPERSSPWTDDRHVYIQEADIILHVKPSAKMHGVDALGAPARRLCWIGARDNILGKSSLLAEYDAKNSPGDAWSCTVATVRGVIDISKINNAWTTPAPVTSVIQRRTTPVDVALPQGAGVSNFDLVWYFGFGDDGGLEVTNLLCVRQTAAAAGISITGDIMTDVLDASTVYARIDATDMSNGDGIVQVLKDPQGTSQSTPHVVWLPLYDLTNNTVTADHRAQSLVNLQLLHA